MMRKQSLSLVLGVVAAGALMTACGGGNNNTTGGDGGGGGSAAGPCGLAPVSNPEFCAAETAEPDCNSLTPAFKNHACGVPLRNPPDKLERSSSVEEYSGDGPPDIACFLPGSYPDKPGTSQAVTMKGSAKIFSHGCQSNNVTITVHKVKRTGGSDDGEIGEVVGSAVTTPDDCTANALESDEEGCDPVRYECNFEYANVPTETELAIKTEGPGWAALIDYNIFIRNDKVVDGAWTHDVRALAEDDYGVIAQVAIGGPITPSHGAIAGEIHDCGDVRLINAVVDVSKPRKITTYFTNDEAHPLPDLSALGTSTLGLYSAMDIESGPVSVAAAGYDADGTLVSIGYLRVHVYPDAVTTVTFRGLIPTMVP